ncbi:MAG: hypothetical protein IJU21_04095 [Bacteroidales bacterium]|nr:hypothetical protein [Bacteroidales bacterium]
MKEGTLVCDFSGAYGAQGLIGWLDENGSNPKVLDFTRLDGTSCYCDSTAQEEIARRLPESLPGIRWIDSGDYHYMTYILAKRETQPFHLLLLDNHPDNQDSAFGGILSCGSWVKAIRENPMLKGVLTIGPEMKEYPEGWAKGKRVYISLDKDIMSREYARTNWDQGEFSLPDVEFILRKVALEGEIAAVDICGESSPAKGATPEDARINFETNTKLYNLICQN